MNIGKISGENFDCLYIKEDIDRRGRSKGEVAELLSQGVQSAGFDMGKAQVILDEKDAFTRAVENSKNGDLIVIFFEKREPLLDILYEIMQKSSNMGQSSKVV